MSDKIFKLKTTVAPDNLTILMIANAYRRISSQTNLCYKGDELLVMQWPLVIKKISDTRILQRNGNIFSRKLC